MIGDGANDCSAIKQADAGISFGNSDAGKFYLKDIFFISSPLLYRFFCSLFTFALIECSCC
jgi:P-type E1-E2 ATPase